MFMQEIAEKKVAAYNAHEAQRKADFKSHVAIKQDFHIRAMLKSLVK